MYKTQAILSRRLLYTTPVFYTPRAVWVLVRHFHALRFVPSFSRSVIFLVHHFHALRIGPSISGSVIISPCFLRLSIFWSCIFSRSDKFKAGLLLLDDRKLLVFWKMTWHTLQTTVLFKIIESEFFVATVGLLLSLWNVSRIRSFMWECTQLSRKRVYIAWTIIYLWPDVELLDDTVTSGYWT